MTQPLVQSEGAQGLLDALALSTMPVPVVGDVAGLASDAYRFATDPESRTLGNAAWASLGMLPFIPFAGIFAGKGAKTADAVKLAEAQKLEQAGAEARDIWDKTGWFKSPDGEWRFEIDDSPARIGKAAENQWIDQGGMSGKAAGVMWHDDLYNAYPDTRRIDIDLAQGTWKDRPRDAYISGENIGGKAGSLGDARRILLHEFQHAIQNHEGMAMGGNPAMIPLNTKADRANFRKAWEHINRPASFEDWARHGVDPDIAKSADQQYADYVKRQEKTAKTMPDSNWQRILADYMYRNSAGEAEARAVETRRDFTPEQRRAAFPLDSYDVPLDQLIVRRR